MPKCNFSGESIRKGTGLMYVLKDGKVLHFKNTKCLKNFIKLKRKPLKTKWTQSYHAEKQKRLVTIKSAATKPKVVQKPKVAEKPKVEVKAVKPAVKK